VVASRVGGIPEVVTDGRDGFLVDLQDTEAMAQRAIEILADDQRRVEMGRQGRESAKARFCSDKIIRQYEEYYRKILSAA
jgi:glycosyltransferase involved in cell wall biosynthesis